MTSVRLDPATRATLETLARRRGQTKSDVLRDAISELAGQEAAGVETALDRLRPWVGIIDSGDGRLSERTGERFRELVEEKHRARRAD